MKRFATPGLGAVLATAMATGAFAAPPPDVDREVATLKALRAANNQAMAARHLDQTLDIVAEDYVLVGGNDGIHRSRSEMAQLWARDFADPASRPCVRTPDRIDVGDAGGVRRAAEVGAWTCPRPTPEGDQRLSGRYLAHWSKRSGAWKVVSDNYVTLACQGAGCDR